MKKISIFISALCLAAMAPLGVQAQSEFQLKPQTLSNPDNVPAPVFPVPSERQLKWNETEYYGFFHYGMNTYTGKEWGDGTESESTFNPTKKPNPRQWLEVAKKAGMKGGIAVVKHHDGFCLWPTATTTHSVKNSNTTYGKQTNIPKDFAEAANALGMKYGFYISPWDLSNKYWGEKDSNGKYTDNYAKKVFLPQCVELAKYGDKQFEMWFDGATGGDHAGSYGRPYGTEKRTIDNAQTYYDIPNLRDSIHNLLPDVIMWGVGGEARWIGNEQGWAGETCWSMGDAEEGDENGWQWLPGESDAMATTNGWFWNSKSQPKGAEELFKIYLETVGRNATLILNIPPNKDGEIASNVATRLEELGKLISTRLGTDLAKKATITANKTRTKGASRNYNASNMIDGNKDTYWATNDGDKTATITLQWNSNQKLRYVALQEYIKLGQRVKKFKIETSTDGKNFTERATQVKQTTIGYKRIIPLHGSTTNSYQSGVDTKYLRITIEDSKACPLIHTISVY